MTGNDIASSMTVDASGYVYVTGWSFEGEPSYNYATIKYDPNGDTLWVRQYDGPAFGLDQALALAVDASGNVYVTGRSTGSGTDYDYATIKYDSNGDTLWVRRYNGTGNGADFANALTLDISGNVYVTGYSYGDTISLYDYVTIKYNANGDSLWVRRYNGPGNLEDNAHELQVDNSGNVYVTGESKGSGTGVDFATIKYDSNGDSLWVRRYNDPNNLNDGAYALAMDVSGNVYVSGYSTGLTTGPDYTTIKYAPNGDSLWTARYDGGSSGIDEALALAMDAFGNVYVTGNSYGDSLTGYDIATIKYKFIPPTPIGNDTLVFTAYSPVNLVVTDPKGDSIGLDTTGTRPDTIFNTILEGSTYDATQDVSNPPDGEKDIVVTIPKPYVGEYKIRVVPDGEGTYSLGIRIDGSDEVRVANNVVVPESSTTYDYSVLTTLRGDVNKSGSRNLTDIIFLVNYIFKGGIAPDPAEIGNVNCSTGAPNLSDIIYMVNYVFKGGKAPCS